MFGRQGDTAGLTRKMGFKRWYQRLASSSSEVRDWTFMNYGFLDLDEVFEWPELDESDERNRLPIQLYHLLYSQPGLRGKSVLDIGSGRGGGASYAARYLEPASVIGVDYADKAVAFCREVHGGVANLEFFRGDAEMLPIEDATLDVVSNVEVSHCFASMESFLENVVRVLKPGGSFVYTDFRDVHMVDDWHAQLHGSGLELAWHLDITPNVGAAMDIEGKHAAVKEMNTTTLPDDMHQAFEGFAGLRGSAIFEGLQSRETIYHAFQFVKPGAKRRPTKKKTAKKKTAKKKTAKKKKAAGRG